MPGPAVGCNAGPTTPEPTALTAFSPALLARRWLAPGLLALTGVAGATYWAGHNRAPGTAATDLPAPVFSPAPPTPLPPPTPAPLTAAAPAAAPVQAPPRPAPLCKTCGVVTSVQAVQHTAPTSGVGALAGGVLGGVLGNQMGKGHGRAAMTVLGAVGGGVAGNELEKRRQATTTYRVQVRTDGGTLRTLEQRTAPVVGQRVRIEGGSLHALAG